MNFDFSKKYLNKDADNKYAKSEIKAVIHSIMAITRNKKNHFIDPLDEHRLPKLKQLNIAKNYFEILPYEFSILKKKNFFKESVTKPLNNSEVGNKILFTTKVNQNDLTRPYPWFIQKAILNGKDVTCVYINNNIYFFYCKYKRGGKNIDWRIEINTKSQSKWLPLVDKNLKQLKSKVGKLMKKFKLNYGRLDFIEQNGKYYFLEVNPNGQFGWLDLIDNNEKFLLHNKFVNAFLKN